MLHGSMGHLLGAAVELVELASSGTTHVYCGQGWSMHRLTSAWQV
jgi:hypothetical protein